MLLREPITPHMILAKKAGIDMATVAESLFGVSPESLLAAREQRLQEQAMQYGKMSPIEAARAGFYEAGSRLGSGIGGLLGAEDPELIKARRLQELSKQFDLTTIQGASEAAKALSQAGYQREAMALADRVNTMRKTEADYLKATRGTPGTASERSRSMIAGLEVKLAKGEQLTPEEQAQARWLIAQETKPKAFRDAESGELITIQPLDIAQAAPNLAKFLGGSQASAPVTPGSATSEVGQTVSPAPGVTITKVGEGKGLDPGTVKELGNIDANLTKLGSSVSSLKNIDSRIKKLDLGLIQNLARGGAAAVGINTADRTEFDSLQRTALKEANNLLLLAKGAQTEGDAQRARDQIADPNTWKNKDALKKAFEDLQATHEQTIEALTAQRKTLTSKGKAPAPSGAGAYSKAQEDLISRWMAANKRSREEVISYLKSQGKL